MCRMVISESSPISLCLIGWTGSQPARARLCSLPHCASIQLVVNMIKNKRWVLLRNKTNQTKNTLKITKKILGVKYSWVALFETLLQIQQRTAFTKLVSEGSFSVLPPTWSHTRFLADCGLHRPQKLELPTGYAVICPATSVVYFLPMLFHLVFLAIKMHALV